MSELGVFSTFKNSELGCSLTTLKVNNDIWFLGNEFAKTLGHTNPQKAIRDHVDESDKFYITDIDTGDLTLGTKSRGVNESFTPLQIQPYTVVITESGAYCLILRSKLQTAKKFTKWVTKEVLPYIRKTGVYGLQQPNPAPALPEGPLAKLRTITPKEISELSGVERKIFRYESLIKSNKAKNQYHVKRGRRGGKEMQQRRRNIIDERNELKAKNIDLNLEIARLKLEKKVLQDELDEIVDFVENF